MSFWTDRNVFVTGATGLLGSHLTEELLARGARVTVLVLDRNTMTEGLDIDGWTGSLVRALAQRFRDLEKTVRASGLRRS